MQVVTFDSDAFEVILKKIECIERYVKRTADLFADLDETLELTSREVMDVFGVSKTTVYRWRNDGSIPFRIDEKGNAMYPYKDVFLAIKDGSLNIQNSNKAMLLAKLAEFKDKIISSSLWHQVNEDNQENCNMK